MAKKPMPGQAPTYYDKDMRFFDESAVEGGGPTPDKAMKARRDLADMAGDEGRYATAVRARAANIEGHNALTEATKRKIKLNQMQSAAEAPGASRYAKDRYKFAKQTGMVGNAKGGSVKKMAKGGSASRRADGCCSKGKTKGSMR